MAFLITVELFTLWFAVQTPSSVRALAGAEDLWSKAQKDALYQLEKYHRTQDESDYMKFRRYISVPLGDHTARLELLNPHPNIDAVRKGFLQGRVHSDDIEGIIHFLQRSSTIDYVANAITYLR